ncbi:hypothetical protein [Kitasatospora sp. SUK 42]|uniref:hypothetical protein n=1 Tax=Kitasatospora sp. SUK 42 TaxID=1588882 RepID=UPI0018C9A630|nr:hypothetical protein [Kitasatospora sp. SUK 42]MBV2152751.1 DUF357 domain-containing protein [Kitasatospora sp. SUK 42]
MSNPPPLHAEDRPEYERLLGEALRDRTVLPALRAPGAPTAEQLRSLALRDADGVNAAAATEYAHYTALRDSLRATPPTADGPAPAAPGLLGQLRSANGGAGLFPALTVLTPILAWAAALVLLLVGYLLQAADPTIALARPLITAGWVALAAGVAAMAVGVIGLLLTAIRDGAAPAPPGTDRELAAELADARTEWRAALRERGLLPYLHSRLPAVPGRPAPGYSSPDFNSPGYSSPDFTSPGPDLTSPGYTPPAFTSPGPEGITGSDGRPDFTGPGYTPPAFTSPDDVG